MGKSLLSGQAASNVEPAGQYVRKRLLIGSIREGGSGSFFVRDKVCFLKEEEKW